MRKGRGDQIPKRGWKQRQLELGLLSQILGNGVRRRKRDGWINGRGQKRGKEWACLLDGNDAARSVAWCSMWKKVGIIWKIKGSFSEGTDIRVGRAIPLSLMVSFLTRTDGNEKRVPRTQNPARLPLQDPDPWWVILFGVFSHQSML